MTASPDVSAVDTRRRGTVLIAVIFVTVAIAGMALVLCRSVRVEAMASANHVASAQAGAVERGAEQYVLALVAQQAESWMDLDMSYFYAIQLPDGYFWLLRPDYGDASLPLYGLVDEGSKLNLNSATPEMLIALPNIPPELTFSIKDWRDDDAEITEDGAESEYYMSLREPYYCKNAPFESVEEVLLVRGAYPQLLYGYEPEAGAARGNSYAMGGAMPAGSAGDRWAARGLYDLLTVHSQEPVQEQGTGDGGGGGGQNNANGPFNVNSRSGRRQLEAMLEPLLGEERADELTDGGGGYRDIFDYYIKRKPTPEEFAQFADKIVVGDPQRRGRINLNTAPREVLLCLPNMDESKADQIIAARQGNVDRRSLAWVAEALGQAAVGIGEDDWVTGRSHQYSADILAVSNDGRAFKRCRVIVDTTGTVPKIVQRRDLTERGWPLEQQVLDSLRTGNGVPGVSPMSATGARLR